MTDIEKLEKTRPNTEIQFGDIVETSYGIIIVECIEDDGTLNGHLLGGLRTFWTKDWKNDCKILNSDFRTEALKKEIAELKETIQANSKAVESEMLIWKYAQTEAQNKQKKTLMERIEKEEHDTEMKWISEKEEYGHCSDWDVSNAFWEGNVKGIQRVLEILKE